MENSETTTTSAGEEQRPSAAPESSLAKFLLYTASLPERIVRSTVGVAAGATCEAAQVLVPRSFQSSKTYEFVITNSLTFLTKNVGGVETNAQRDAEAEPNDYLARKAVGNFVDLAGLATLHVSPMWLLAIVSDVAYGSKTYVHELSDELKKRGIINEASTIDRVDDVLDAIRNAAGETATLFDTPPLSVDQLKATLERTRAAVGSADYKALLPEAELNAYWKEMRAIATKEDVSLLGVSGALTMHALGKLGTATQGALTGVQVAGGLLNRHVIGHYADALHNVREKGFYPTIRETSAPYVRAVWKNFAARRQTLTSKILTGALFRQAWRGLKTHLMKQRGR